MCNVLLYSVKHQVKLEHTLWYTADMQVVPPYFHLQVLLVDFNRVDIIGSIKF